MLCSTVHMVTRVTLRIKVDLVLFRFKIKLAVVDLSIFIKRYLGSMNNSASPLVAFRD